MSLTATSIITRLFTLFFFSFSFSVLSLVTHGVTSCDGSFAIEDIYEDVYEDELRREVYDLLSNIIAIYHNEPRGFDYFKYRRRLFLVIILSYQIVKASWL